MLMVDFIETATKKRFSSFMGGGLLRQYTMASLLGATPGCLGAFMNVSLYVHGVISFGAVVGGMIATSGDEAFVMLAQFPGTAAMLFGLLFISGIIFAGISDKLAQYLKLAPCEACRDGECEYCDADLNNRERKNDTFHPVNIFFNLKSISFTRFLLLSSVFSFMVLVILGKIGSNSWDWKRVTFICLSICVIYMTITASEHYLHYHIWGHIIKKHLFRVF